VALVAGAAILILLMNILSFVEFEEPDRSNDSAVN
jgi:hypothetical protein